jgi:very-short-patch-repair endonuclease
MMPPWPRWRRQIMSMHPLTALDLTGGVARWSRLARMGVSRGTLVALARQGFISRPARGVFCRPELVGSAEVQAEVASGQLTCAAGAVALGLDTWGEAPVCHVRTPLNPRAARRQSAVVVHPWGLGGPGQTAGIETVLHDCACCLPTIEAVVIVDSALRKGLVDFSDWVRVIGSGPHPNRVTRVLALADAQSQSVLESVARSALVLAGIADVSSQVWFAEVGWVDLLIHGWLVIELDGRRTHQPAFQEDRRRDAELTRRGLVVLRFTYMDLKARLPWFVEVVAETLDRGRHPFADLRRGEGWDIRA